jgi:hypothetical protein
VTARRLALGFLACLALVLTTACQPTLQQDTGVVVSVDSPALGRVDAFELLNRDGERRRFDTTELEFRPDFPAAHLSEHMVLGDPIEVTFKTDGERRIVTQLDDA